MNEPQRLVGAGFFFNMMYYSLYCSDAKLTGKDKTGLQDNERIRQKQQRGTEANWLPGYLICAKDSHGEDEHYLNISRASFRYRGGMPWSAASHLHHGCHLCCGIVGRGEAFYHAYVIVSS